jgi:hypothetical protein
MSGYAGTASASPFAPAALPPSARFVPPDRYWGFGGGYSKTGGTDRANDDLNFFRESIYCRHRCYGSSYYNSCYRNSCYTPRYSSGCYYPSSYSSRYCWR